MHKMRHADLCVLLWQEFAEEAAQQSITDEVVQAWKELGSTTKASSQAAANAATSVETAATAAETAQHKAHAASVLAQSAKDKAADMSNKLARRV